MKLSAVGSGVSSAQSQQENPAIKAIDKQIAELQKQLQKVRADKKLDPKTKTQNIAKLQEQIAELQQQKIKVQAEDRKAKQAERAQTGEAAVRREQEELAQEVPVTTSVQKGLLELESAKQTKKQLGQVRAEIKGKLRIAESKSYLRDPNPEAAAELREKLGEIDGRVMGKMKKASDRMEAAGQAERPDKAGEDGEDEQALPADGERAERKEARGRGNNRELRRSSGSGRRERGQFMDDEA